MRTDAGCENGAQGTIYWLAHDLLYLNNEMNESSRKTQIAATVRDPENFPDQHMIANYLFIGDESSIDIRNYELKEILFPTLVMLDKSTMRFDLLMSPKLVIKFETSFLGP